MNQTFLYLLIVVLLVAANGFFVAAEFSLVSVRRSRIISLVESGDARAATLLGLLDHLNSYISATQLGITMASLALGWIGEPALSRLLEAPLHGLVSDAVRHTIAFAGAFTIITFLHIVLGELAPKTLALDRAERVALAIAWPLRLFHTLFSWPIRMLDFAGRSTVWLLGLRVSPDHASIYTIDELRQIINISHTSGTLEADEQQLLHRIFEFSDSEVRDVMIPRNAVAALPVIATLDETLATFNHFGYSRIPVYQDQLDNIIGIVVRRDLEPFLSRPDTLVFTMATLIHPPRFIPANAQLSTALKQMQSTRSHMIFVVDEYGGFEGIITLEDLLEEIVGEIDDEFDDVSPDQCVVDNDDYLLDGMLTMREVNIRLSLHLPEDEPYSTIAGFLLAQSGRLLQQGEFIMFDDIRFTVENVDQKKDPARQGHIREAGIVKIPARLIKVSGILLVAFATLVTATAFFLPYLLDVNAYRTEIIASLQQSLNRQVSFGSGSFAWNFGPSFQFKSFTVKERDGVTDFVKAKQISVQLALMPLLKKKVELKSLTLDETTISLFRNSDGTFNIDDLLKPGKDGVRVDFKKIRLNNGAILWSDMVGNKEPFSSSLRNISLTADHLGRGRKGHVKLIADIPAVNGAPTQISLSGNLLLPSEGISLHETVADFNLSVKQAEIGRFWPYFGRFIPFANTGGRLDFVTSFKGKPQDFSAKGKVLVSGSSVNWPTVFRAPLSPNTLQLEYTVALTNQLLDISAVDISFDGFRIKGSFKLLDYMSKDPRIIARASTPSTFRYEDVRNYVPYKIIDSGTSDYIENKIKTGIFKLDTGTLDGRISQITHMEIGQNCNTLLIRGPVRNAVVSYGPKAPTFNNIQGVIELKGKNFSLIGMAGNFGTSPFTLDGTITEYNTDKPSDYPITMNISPQAPEMGWLAKVAGIPTLEYSNSSSLRLTGSGHYSAYKLNGDWDLKQAAYALPGYVNKPHLMPHTLKFSTIIGKESTKVTSVNYLLQPLVITGSGLIGYGEKPYLGFDLQTNKFSMGETLPILSMWQKYKIKGMVQAKIKGGGDPGDLSAMDYFGTVNLSKISFLPDDHLKQVSGISGLITFKGNSLETSSMAARYGNSVVTLKAAIKSLKKPEGDITLSSQQLFLRDLNLAEGRPDAGIKRFNANVTLRNESISLNSVSGLVNSSNFNLTGVYLTGRTPQATITVTSSKLDLDELRIFSSPAQKADNSKSTGLNIKLTLNVEAGNFGKLAFSKLNAAAQQENGTIYLQNFTAGLLGGKLAAHGRIAPGGDTGDRYDLTFDITRADAEKLFAALDISREVTGSLSLHGNLTARGNTLLDVKKSALGNIRLTMNNGTLRKFNTLSKVFSILNVSQLLKFKLPDMASGGMPYSSIKGSISVKDGIMSTQDLFISSNAINVSIVGNADIVKEELNLTMGAQPLQTVDKIVNRIPIVGWLLTGNDKNLVTAYFEAKGKWSDPQVSAIPVKSMGKGILNIFIRAFELPVKLFTDTGEVILGQ